MTHLTKMTPKQRVFGTMKNILAIVESDEPIDRKQLCRSLENAISWESQLTDCLTFELRGCEAVPLE